MELWPIEVFWHPPVFKSTPLNTASSHHSLNILVAVIDEFRVYAIVKSSQLRHCMYEAFGELMRTSNAFTS